MPRIDAEDLTRIMEEANKEIGRLHMKIVKYHQGYLDNYRNDGKFVGSNAVGLKYAQFLKDVHIALETSLIAQGISPSILNEEC